MCFAISDYALGRTRFSAKRTGRREIPNMVAGRNGNRTPFSGRTSSLVSTPLPSFSAAPDAAMDFRGKLLSRQQSRRGAALNSREAHGFIKYRLATLNGFFESGPGSVCFRRERRRLAIASRREPMNTASKFRKRRLPVPELPRQSTNRTTCSASVDFDPRSLPAWPARNFCRYRQNGPAAVPALHGRRR